MNNDNFWIEIITEAIKKGWNPNPMTKSGFKWSFTNGTFFTTMPVWNGKAVVEEMGAANVEKIIFDHNFAKIFFGEGWEINLVELVKSENRVNYFESYKKTQELLSGNMELSPTTE